MRDNSLSSNIRKIDYIFEKIRDYKSDDGEIDSYLAKYLCIITSGFLEESIRNIFGQFVKNKSHAYVANYVDDRLYYFQNAKAEEMIRLTYSFSKKWGENLKNFMTDERRDSINTIVSNKNLIAHGKNSGITYSAMRKDWENSKEVVEFIKSLCKL